MALRPLESSTDTLSTLSTLGTLSALSALSAVGGVLTVETSGPLKALRWGSRGVVAGSGGGEGAAHLWGSRGGDGGGGGDVAAPLSGSWGSLAPASPVRRRQQATSRSHGLSMAQRHVLE